MGEGDEIGAGNFMTPDNILAALEKVKKGEIIDLSHHRERQDRRHR